MKHDDGFHQGSRDRRAFSRAKQGPERAGSAIDAAFDNIRAHCFSEAEEILKARLLEHPRDREALGAMIHLFLKAEKIAGLDRTVEYVRKCGLLDTRLSTLSIRAFGKLGHVDKAIDVFQHAIETNSADPKLVSAAIEACDRCDSIEDAEFVFDVAKAKGVADVFVYTAMITLHDNFNEQNTSLSIFQEAKTNKVVPDKHMYTAAIGACGRGGMVAEARKIFEEADYSNQADSFTYTSMINTYRRRGKYAEAQEIFQRAVDKKLVDGVMVEAMHSS